MGKLIEELKPGDTIYTLYIHDSMRTVMCVDNASKVFGSLGRIDYLSDEINASSLCELKLSSIEHVKNVNDENLYTLFYDKPFEGLHSHHHGNVSCDVVRGFGFNYKIYSTNKEELIEKARNILIALKILQEDKHRKQKKAINDSLLNIEKL
jgi:hypothetical protein